MEDWILTEQKQRVMEMPINQLWHNPKKHVFFAVFGDLRDGEQNIDAKVASKESKEELLHLMKTELSRYDDVSDGLVLLGLSKDRDGILLCCVSTNKKCRALEMLEEILHMHGMTRGDASYAKGSVSATLLQALMEEKDCESPQEYFLNRTSQYYSSLQEIVAITYGVEKKELIQSLPIYYKKKVAWSYVKTCDIACAGTKIRIKTLENDTGIELYTSPDVYIMIGCKGEVYDIKRQKFENSYEATDQQLDIFEQEMEFIPTVEILSGNAEKESNLLENDLDIEEIAIDEMAFLCYPKRGSGIYAAELLKKTKVFINDSGDYFIGNIGDYMAIRLDDLTDIYIIQRDIFLRTYEG